MKLIASIFLQMSCIVQHLPKEWLIIFYSRSDNMVHFGAILYTINGPLSPQEVAERTGQKYPSVRLTLSRMHEAREIHRPCRGKYTTLHHPSLRQNSMDHAAKTSDTLDT